MKKIKKHRYKLLTQKKEVEITYKRKSYKLKKKIEVKYKNQTISPFQYLDYIFRGEIPEQLNEFNPYLINSLLANHDYFILIVDLINQYIYYLPKKMIFKLLIVFLKGEKKYIDYVKKDKIKSNKLLEEMNIRIRKYYKWSNKEFRYNYETMKSVVNIESFLKRLAFSDKEIKQLQKLI